MSVVASLPQNTHLPFVPDWCSGIQREETPAFSFMPSSHSRLPHHFVRAKPPRPEAISLTSSQVDRSKVFSSRFALALSSILSWMRSSSSLTALSSVSSATKVFSPLSRRTMQHWPFSRSRGPISMRSGTPRISYSAHFQPMDWSESSSFVRTSMASRRALSSLAASATSGFLCAAMGMTTACTGAMRGGRTRPLLSPWVMITAPIMRVVEPQEVWNGYWSLLSRPAKVTS